MVLKQLRFRLNRSLMELEQAKRGVETETAALEKTEARAADLTAATKLTQEVAEAVQRSAHERLSRVVSRCLKTVFFDKDIELRLEVVAKRGRTEVSLKLVEDGLAVTPRFGSFGGAVDVAALGLRLACLVMSGNRRFLCLDEPLKFVSKGYRGRLRELIMDLATETKVQFLIVTHMEELAMGKVVRL